MKRQEMPMLTKKSLTMLAQVVCIVPYSGSSNPAVPESRMDFVAEVIMVE
jgi:hypothetical protein